MAIANRLGISEATVGTYWGRVRIKFGPFSRTELVAIMLRAEQEAAVVELRKANADLLSEMKAQGVSGNTFSFRDLLENAPDAIFLISQQGIIEYANRAAEEMFDYPSGSLSGVDHLELIPERYRGVHVELTRAFFHEPDRRPMGDHLDTYACRKDGSEFLIRASLSPLNSDAESLAICAVRAAPDLSQV